MARSTTPVASAATPAAPPSFSICIPTYNRAPFLDDCLSRLAPLNDQPRPFEIVISDNGSTDDTAQVVKAHGATLPIRYFLQPENRGVVSNYSNVLRLARGEAVTFLADDDSLIHENLLVHIERMLSEPDISVIYADWLAWDDENGREMHRYFGLTNAVTFAPSDPLGLVNFMLKWMISAEIGVFRRSAMLSSFSFCKKAMAMTVWMYGLSRHGRVRFDPLPFYREHRVPKPGLRRTHWANMEMQFQYIGDEMRLSLEATLLLALQDSGQTHLPPDQMENAHRAIDRILHARTNLEIERAIARGDFILAMELRRRVVLWNGPGDADQVRNDVMRIVLPAAALSIALTYGSLSEVKGLRLQGFEGPWLADFLARWRPEIPVSASDELSGDQVLVVHRDEQSLATDSSVEARNALVFERLVRQSRVARDRVDISTL